MPPITKVKISELVTASRSHAEAQVTKANANGNAHLTQTEARNLPADLQDNFAASQFKQSWGSVKTADLTREFTVMMEAFAKSADKNGDGYLSTTEARALPRSLQDNFANYLAAQRGQQVDGDGYTTRNITPDGLVKAHLDAFGPGRISYEDAFAKALTAVATDEYGLKYFVQEFGGPDGQGEQDPAKVDQEVRALLQNGTVRLVDLDADIPTGEEVKDAWIFSVSTDGQGDHGMWAIVDRNTGETTVSTFN